jgi:hypothetical protein
MTETTGVHAGFWPIVIVGSLLCVAALADIALGQLGRAPKRVDADLRIILLAIATTVFALILYPILRSSA